MGYSAPARKGGCGELGLGWAVGLEELGSAGSTGRDSQKLWEWEQRPQRAVGQGGGEWGGNQGGMEGIKEG